MKRYPREFDYYPDEECAPPEAEEEYDPLEDDESLERFIEEERNNFFEEWNEYLEDRLYYSE